MDTSTTLDTGDNAHGGDVCWMNWHAAPTRDGVAGPGTWSVKDSAGRTVVDLAADPFIFDWPNARTGWMRSLGILGTTPEKLWNSSRAHFEPQPDDDWKRAHRVPVAYLGGTAHAIWEQSSAGAWRGFCDLMALIRASAPMRLPQLPMIAHTGSKRVAMGLGGTLVPTFELVRYVDRPPCLPADDDGAGAPAPSTPAGKPVTRPAAPSYRLPAKPERQAPLVDDEIPFAPCWQ